MFYVFPRVRRSEFRWGIVNESGREIGNIADEQSARRIVEIMNMNCLSPERLAALEIVSKESFRPRHYKNVLNALRNQELRV